MLITTQKLKTLSSNRDSLKLIINAATIENSIENGTLEMLDLNGFYLLISTLNLYGIMCLDFGACERKN